MNDYSDIIDHPHYQSSKRPHMSMTGRAAQFSAFAALTGYDRMIEDTRKEVMENGRDDEEEES
ncbi:MAG: hypothetical protein IKI20_07430 [Lachnospiraceae bacterium]|nr:hypothetical protein [Lachnospiraceae bacterium]